MIRDKSISATLFLEHKLDISAPTAADVNILAATADQGDPEAENTGKNV